MELAIIKHTSQKYLLNLSLIILALILALKANMQYNKEIEALKKQRDTEIKKGQILEELRQIKYKLRAYKNLLNKKEESSIINLVSNLAAVYKAQVISIKPNPERKQEVYTELPFDLTLKAPDYHALANFISGLESHKNVFMIESIDIAYDEGKDTLDCSLRLLYFITYD